MSNKEDKSKCFKDKYDVMNYNYMKFLEEYLLAGKTKTFAVYTAKEKSAQMSAIS
ncbi:MAG: hypothetical protein K5836_03050 [Clostridiales bacterium]|nr:hypothetical protein [Clostridiales bacterium]